MKLLFRIIAFYVVLMSACLHADTLVIEQSGIVSLGDDLVELAGVNVIQITVSNVILDLGEHIVAGGIDGIVVDANLSNITIRNGIISNTFSNGITIGENCSSIVIHDMSIASCGGNGIQFGKGIDVALVKACNFNNITGCGISVAQNSANMKLAQLSLIGCGGPAVELLGTSTGDRVEDILIEEAAATECGFASTSSHVFRIRHGENVGLQAININNCINEANDLRVIEFENCDRCILKAINASGNDGRSLTGLSLINTNSSIFSLFNILNCHAHDGDLQGFVTESSSNSIFVGCSILTSSATNGDAYGFNMNAPSIENIFRECDVASLKGNNVYGFDIDSGGGTPLKANIFGKCSVIRSIALTGTTVGFNIGDGNRGTVVDCSASYNESLTGTSIGLHITSGVRWTVSETKLVRNFGPTDANSFGIKLETGTSNVFSRNFAFDNGETPGNQMNGVPSGSVTQLSPNNMNTADSPWANIVVTVV